MSLKMQHPQRYFGAGLKFLSSYDLNRCVRAFRFKQFDKKHLSALTSQPAGGSGLIAVGEFNGELHVVSPLDNTLVVSLKVVLLLS